MITMVRHPWGYQEATAHLLELGRSARYQLTNTEREFPVVLLEPMHLDPGCTRLEMAHVHVAREGDPEHPYFVSVADVMRGTRLTMI